ncbi:MAG TPA: response regulator [Opitutaceae bacterium]|jgi:DNA-binding response OmpR family regulator|nr:response regulator [Opitutaceae bacterium]
MNLRNESLNPGAVPIQPVKEKLFPKVLVVDDSRQIRETVNWLLHDSGYWALEAEDGMIAKLLLLSEHVVLIITDLEMPVCDGWELLAFCHKEYPDIPVVIMSGESLGRRPGIECWASGFLHKPFNLAQFQAEIQRLVPRATPQASLNHHLNGRQDPPVNLQKAANG